jgi:hypothetical protein
MKAFEFYFNGRRTLTAGIGHRVGTLHSMLEIHAGILNHIVRGEDLVAQETVDWSVPQPKVGDEITIKIIDTDHVSPADGRYPRKQRSHGAERSEPNAKRPQTEGEATQ